MYENILVPTDGSDAAATAGKAAFALARRFDADLHAIHVLDTESDREYGSEVIAAIEDAAAEVDVPTTTTLVPREGSVPQSIITYAEDHDVDCIVMGTTGRSGLRQYVLGSVTERTLREAPVPVVTVHEDTVITSDVERLLVPTDGSDSATAAVDHGVDLAEATGAALHLVHVVEPHTNDLMSDETLHDSLESAGRRALDDAITRARRAGLPEIEATLLSGRAHEAIKTYVDHSDIDHVVMGTHGHSGVSRYVLGSVTERVVRLVDVPVVTVKTGPPSD